MKKIIDGKMYNTETAKELNYWSNNLGPRDFSHMTETLYRKKTGEFFLHGEGGARTKYAESCGHGWTSGEQIVPLTFAEAKEWAEENLDADEYEEIFGEVPEDNSKVLISLTVSVTCAEMLKRRASESGKTQGEIVEEALRK